MDHNGSHTVGSLSDMLICGRGRERQPWHSAIRAPNIYSRRCQTFMYRSDQLLMWRPHISLQSLFGRVLLILMDQKLFAYFNRPLCLWSNDRKSQKVTEETSLEEMWETLWTGPVGSVKAAGFPWGSAAAELLCPSLADGKIDSARQESWIDTDVWHRRHWATS